MFKQKFKEVTAPKMSQQTLYQLTQMKTYVDNSLISFGSKKFENEADKIKYLLDTLQNIRDFVLSQTTENSVRIELINQFNKIEEEVALGNASRDQEEKQLKSQEEISEQSP